MPRVQDDLELEPCPPGTYNPGGWDECKPCEPGTFATQPGQPECQNCFKGYMCPNSSAVPEQCPVGTYNNLTRQICCRVCPSGKFGFRRGMYQCDDCPSGTRCPVRTKLACEMNDITSTTSTSTSTTTTTRATTTSTSTTTTVHVCSTKNPCRNGGTCQPVGRYNFTCQCANYYYGSECEFMNETRDRDVIINVFNRNSWSGVLVVIDVTGSMQTCAAAVTEWMKSAHPTKRIEMYVFFNDGDDKITAEKKIGSTGGIYWSNSTDISEVRRTMDSARINGSGGDIPENDIEAIIYGAKICPSCSNIVHIADNGATPRDLELLPQLANKSIKVIPCQVLDGINPAMIEIARQTNGSLHTLEEDFTNLSAIRINQTIVIDSYTYHRLENGFVRI